MGGGVDAGLGVMHTRQTLRHEKALLGNQDARAEGEVNRETPEPLHMELKQARTKGVWFPSCSEPSD